MHPRKVVVSALRGIYDKTVSFLRWFGLDFFRHSKRRTSLMNGFQLMASAVVRLQRYVYR